MLICLSPCRRVFVLAAALRQYVLPPRSSASLYDPTDDEWMSESKGNLAGVSTDSTDLLWLIFRLSFSSTFFFFFLWCHLSLCFFPWHILLIFFYTSQQCGGDPQSWTKVFAVLKGTSLSCYHRQEDVEANVQPAFTIAINKVRKRVI